MKRNAEKDGCCDIAHSIYSVVTSSRFASACWRGGRSEKAARRPQGARYSQSEGEAVQTINVKIHFHGRRTAIGYVALECVQATPGIGRYPCRHIRWRRLTAIRCGKEIIRAAAAPDVLARNV